MTAVSNGLVRDAFLRIRDLVADTVADLTIDELAYRPDPAANSIAWLVWHLTRIQDDHICDLAGVEQVWTAQGWAERFDLPFAAHETGYGQDATAVGRVQVGADLLTGYHDAAHRVTDNYLAGLTDADYPVVVDDAWDPPVTLAVRLVSVVSDDLQHAGQAAYLRGLVQRRRQTGA